MTIHKTHLLLAAVLASAAVAAVVGVSETDAPKAPAYAQVSAERGALAPHPVEGGAQALPPGHPPIGATDVAPGADPEGALPAGQSPGSAIEVPEVAKAEGDLGKTIAELFKARQTLAGKRVRVRAVVVKSTPDVMGKSFAHVRDGTGSESQQNHDLTVTTVEPLELGKTVLLEGVVATDRDLGYGYHYPIIVEEARLVVP
jgi:hypothetical protein